MEGSLHKSPRGWGSESFWAGECVESAELGVGMQVLSTSSHAPCSMRVSQLAVSELYSFTLNL